MNIYLSEIREKFDYILYMLPFLLLGMVLLCIFIKGIIRYKKGLVDNLGLLVLIFILLISVFSIYEFICEAGIITVLLHLDYNNCDFSYYSGLVQDVNISKRLVHGKIMINSNIFLASLSMQKKVSEIIGEKIEIVYATNSKYIVDYRIIE